MSVPDLVIGVLAAGASRRLGTPKQLVAVDGEPLLRRQCRTALASGVGPVIVILGCNAAEHFSTISDLPVDVRINRDWAEGLAASVRCAIASAQQRRAALLVLPCDQYRVRSQDLRTLHRRWRWAPAVAWASRWNAYLGPPAILPVHCHRHALRIRGDVGARALLQAPGWPAPDEITNPRAVVDIDTPEDLRAARASSLSARARR